MYSLVLCKEIEEKDILPCYFFYGEETYLAELFLKELAEVLSSSPEKSFSLEKFDLSKERIIDIIDVARTVPFFSFSRQIVVMEIEEKAKDSFSSQEEEILRDYLLSPSNRTILVVIFSGEKIKAGHKICRFFASFPPRLVLARELKPLKNGAQEKWIESKLCHLEKKASPEAKKRLVEIIGNDLRRLDSELEKLAAFVGSRRNIEREDVDQVCEWVSTFKEWDLADSLEKENYEKALLVLHSLFSEGEKPENIIRVLTNFFRDVLAAKAWLEEKEMDRREIFKRLRPYISERYGFYEARFSDFFSFVERHSISDFQRVLSGLHKIDLKIKTSSDINPQTLMEGFLYSMQNEHRRGEDKKGNLTAKGRP